MKQLYILLLAFCIYSCSNKQTIEVVQQTNGSIFCDKPKLVDAPPKIAAVPVVEQAEFTQYDTELDSYIFADSESDTAYVGLEPTTKKYWVRNHCDITTAIIHSSGVEHQHTNAEWLANRLNNTDRNVSWHYSLDEYHILKGLPHRYAAWHSGNKDVNKHSLGIEIAEHTDMDYTIVLANLDKLVRSLILEYPNIEIKMHRHVRKTQCPRIITDDTWNALNTGWESYRSTLQL